MGILPGPGVAAVGSVADRDGLLTVVAHLLLVGGEPGEVGAGDVEVGLNEAIAGVVGALLGLAEVLLGFGDILCSAWWIVRHVRREANTRADKLANLAMDEKHDVVVFDVDGADGGRPASPDAQSTAEPESAEVEEAPVEVAAPGPAGRMVRVNVATMPDAGCCPAGGLADEAFTIATTLPAGLCVHAAHAILPTLLAMLNTDAREFAAVPTLTVRCGRAGCGAVFQLSPVRGPNGASRKA